ncbi:sugar transferase (plasmid) [Gemmobacter aquarius]|uniref:Sugar transferase n=2 Tax=Paragemmobacter aquarius TaxID=2169400 RepID=A0A2S0USC7_9RHOB|nr:sugar transferase [Gemmobacter aquarius]
MTFERGRIEDKLGFSEAERLAIVPTAETFVDVGATSQNTFYRRHGKRSFDITLVLLAAPVWIPLIALLAALVIMDGGNPFYGQSRVGRGGRTFRMWKIRSMVVGADDVLDQYLSADPAIRAEWDEKQKLEKDPRITRVGKLLRKTSFDELPQFWNVLVGDMSLVGPRPMMVDQKMIYPGSAYYALRPGVTGPWQISARNRSSFRERARYDERYLEECSLGHDLRTVLNTVPVVLAGRGV